MHQSLLAKISDKSLIRIATKQLRAYEAKLRRMGTKSAKLGSLKVSADDAEKWKFGKSRKQLFNTLMRVKDDKDFFLSGFTIWLFHICFLDISPSCVWGHCFGRLRCAVARIGRV